MCYFDNGNDLYSSTCTGGLDTSWGLMKIINETRLVSSH